MADGVVIRSDCNVSRLDTSRYLITANSRLATGYLCFVGTCDTNLYGTNDVKIRAYIGNYIFHCIYNIREGGFGGLLVSMLASGTQDRGFKPGRSRRIFRAKKSSTCLPSEGKESRLSCRSFAAG
jgi:hypothetical protein